MKIETLKRLEAVNQLSLTEEQRNSIFKFLCDREKEFEKTNFLNTENVERMVHVMPINTVLREDIVKQPFTREELQSQAPETDDGYWCVPKVLD